MKVANVNNETEANSNLSRPIVGSRIITRGQLIYASIVAFFAWTFSVYDFILFGTLLPVMAKDFGWSTSQSAQIATWVSIGTFLVALTVGPITDRFGRRNALMTTTVGAALSSGLTGFTMSPIYLVIVRALSGLGFSEQAVNTTYLSEISGARRRGLLYSFIQGGWPIGVMLASFMTSALLPSVGWKGVFFVGTIPAIIILILRTKLKESPKFEEMQHVRELVRSGNAEQAKQIGAANGIDTDKLSKSTFAQLFAPDIRRHTIFLAIAFLFNWFAIQIFSVLSTTVLTDGKGLSFNNSLFLLILSNALAYVGYVVHGYVGDRVGRRGTIIVAWLASGIAYTYMLFAAQGYWSVLISYSIGLFFMIGSYSALFTYTGESFPTRVRGTASAFINAMGPIGGIFGSLLFTVFLVQGTVVATFVAGALPLFIGAFLLFGARSIAPSKSLEEISK